MAEPLEEKIYIVTQDKVVKHKLDSVWLAEDEEVIPTSSIKSAVEWLKDELSRRHRPNTEELIDKAFPDLNTASNEKVKCKFCKKEIEWNKVHICNSQNSENKKEGGDKIGKNE